MPKIPSLLDCFSTPGSISIDIDDSVAWLKSQTNPQLLQNQLCNHLLYPESLPLTPADLHLDLALLQEILKKRPGDYYNQNLKRITIPEGFLMRFSDLNQLVWVFTDVFGKPGITTIFLKSEKVGLKGLGTFIKPTVTSNFGWASVWIESKKYEIQVGSLMTIPFTGNRLDIKFASNSAKLLGKSQFITEVIGGGFGLAIDMRH